ncbi:hypothetical protein ABZ707_16920 [Streptomyces sp. NPDC006923]|uniref:hypothetical protein n=1 Tax=Streptomyces sp. NPDC006923 TaxID=3155355 RepID=UPI0033DDC330
MTALREVCECSSRTQADIARRANQAPTTLSNHLNAGRVPEPHLLEGFYKVVQEDALETGRVLPYPLSALLEMRADALKKHCVCCTVGYPAGDQQPEEPASHTVQPSFRKPQQTDHHADARQISGAQAQTRVPVPLQDGDRHPKTHLEERIEETWAELGTLRRYLSEGRDRDAFIVLWSAATTLPSRDLPAVVTACRTAGLNEEADTVLASAGRRDAQAVLNIASVFHHRHLYEDAGLILTAAAEWQRKQS